MEDEMPDLRQKPGSLVRMSAELIRCLEHESAEHVAEFKDCIGVVMGLTQWGPGTVGPEVDVRWQPMNLRYAYAPELLELVTAEEWNALVRRNLVPALTRKAVAATECPQVTRRVTVQFRPNNPLGPYVLNLPAGLRVMPIPHIDCGGYWLDEFPESMFPRGSMILHDAEHYGYGYVSIRSNHSTTQRMTDECID